MAKAAIEDRLARKMNNPSLSQFSKHFTDIKSLLWIDAIGALVTSLTTGLVLATGIIPTGLPAWILFFLSGAALGLAGSDALGLWGIVDCRVALRMVACFNLLYCLAVMIICFAYDHTITPWGVIYFSIESVIVVSLALWEWRVSSDNR